MRHLPRLDSNPGATEPRTYGDGPLSALCGTVLRSLRSPAERAEAGVRWPVSRGADEAADGGSPAGVAPRLAGAGSRGAGDREGPSRGL
jgi:hypothetical protein